MKMIHTKEDNRIPSHGDYEDVIAEHGREDARGCLSILKRLQRAVFTTLGHLGLAILIS